MASVMMTVLAVGPRAWLRRAVGRRGGGARRARAGSLLRVSDTATEHGFESISAITLAVRDMRAATTFYEVLGLRRLYGGAEASFTSYEVGGQYLNLQQVALDDGERRWGRVIFYVADVDAMHARATAAGLRPLFAPRDASWGERYFHLRDPDGHELSFARRLGRGHEHRPARSNSPGT